MNDQEKTKAQLIEEVTALRRRLAALELAASKQTRSDETRTKELAAINKKLEQEIRERKQVEKQLRFQACLLDSVRESVVAIDLEGRVIYWSKGAEALYGYRAGEVMGRRITFIVEAAEQAKEEKRMRQVLESGLWSGQYRQRHKDGAHFWAETVISLVTDENGEPQGMIGIDRDITERRQAEQALRASEARYRSVVEDQTELVCRWLPDTTLTFVNEAYCRYFGKQRRELIGRSVMEVLAPAAQQAIKDHLTGLSPQQPVAIDEYEVILADGGCGWQQWVNRALFDQDGRLIELQSVGRDITRRKRLEENLAALHGELNILNKATRAMASSLELEAVLARVMAEVKSLLKAEGASVLLPAGENELLFASVAGPGANRLKGRRIPRAAGIAGWVMRQKRQARVEDAQRDPRFYGQVDAQIGLTTRSLLAVPLVFKERVIGVIEAINKDGGVFEPHDLNKLEALAASAAIAIENARLYRDLQAQMQTVQETQVQLVQSEKMAALGRLSASIAHEINNPLQAIQNAMFLLKEEMNKRRRRDKLNYFLGIAAEEIERMSEIMNRMRNFYRLSSQKTEVHSPDSFDHFYRPVQEELEQIELPGLLEGVIQLLNPQLRESQIKVKRKLTPQLPPVQGKPDHLKQVVLNLLLNAVEAMTAGGGILHIGAMVDQLRLDGGQLLPAVRLEFSDTGPGIPAEAQSRLFEPFFSTKEQGSGLGLSISYKIIEAHHGQIKVESQPGLGTTFSILLPFEQP